MSNTENNTGLEAEEIIETEEHDHHEDEHECCCHDHHEHEHNDDEQECCHHDHKVHEHHEHHAHKHEHGHSHGHDHGHHHGDDEDEEGSRKIMILRLVASAALWLLARFRLNGSWQIATYALAYMIIGYDILSEAVEGLTSFSWTSEEFLMAVASITAFFIGEAEEAVMVMWLYQLGELLTDLAVDHSKDNIEALLVGVPDKVHWILDGEVIEVDTDRVREGMLLQVKPFEEVPVDGVIEEGSGTIDMSSINGESMPVSVEAGDEVISGSMNMSSLLVVKATKSLEDSTITKIRELVENCQMEKSRTESIVDRFTRFYTPTVIILAVALAALGPLVSSLTYDESIRMACTLLVISCPCALVISVPLAFFCGIGMASRKGVLVKGSEHLEALGQFDYLALDKTGTLTSGEFIVEEAESNMEQDDFIRLCASIERHSNHPLASSIVTRYGKDKEYDTVTDFSEVPGKGVRAVVNEKEYFLGSYGFASENCSRELEDLHKTAVYVVTADEVIGHLVFADEVKQDAREVLSKLKKDGVGRIEVLSGDRQEKVDEIRSIGEINDVFGNLMPEDKVEILRKARVMGFRTAFVGDGTNDAAVLSLADVGIAMGGKGTDTAIASSDVVVMNDSLTGLAAGREIARKTVAVVKQNLWFIVLCKLVFIILGIMGTIPMWAAVFADVGVTLIAVLNTLRLLK
ncbi:MAG: cadmium-translocating P-type ATPase [Erysipelotrichaceae bacterium]|nr:cadmium-translocating P-type ATPase [Erysipelotrichaceae bacterium]